MKYNSFIAFICIVCSIGKVTGQSQVTCYQCSGSPFKIWNYNDYNCVYNLSAATTQRCSVGHYCLTSYVIHKGAISHISRSCGNSMHDHDTSTDSTPTATTCESQVNVQVGSSDSSTCYIACSTDRCNNFVPEGFISCPTSCFGRTCDPYTGRCSTPRRCVQCSSETDENCEDKNEATFCEVDNYRYCSTTRNVVLNLDGQAVRKTLVKSCSDIRGFQNAKNPSRLINKPCQFHTNRNYNQDSLYFQYDCNDYCNTDGCNAKATFDEEPLVVSRLACIKCSQYGSNGNCTTHPTPSRCSAGATYCKSTISYYVNYRQRDGEPVYQIVKMERGCASEELEAQCITTPVENTNLEHVTCQETCQTTGCNVGWH